MSRFSLRSVILGALLGGALWTLPVPHAAAQDRRQTAPADFLGGEEPLPPVPRGARLPAPRRKPARAQHPRLRGRAGGAKRRPRLGAQHGQPPLHRPAGQASPTPARATTSRKTTSPRSTIRSWSASTGEVPVGATCAWSFDDGDGPQKSTFDCAEAGQSARPLRPADGRHRRGSARLGCPRKGFRPRSGCATSSSPGLATASPPAKAIRTAPSRCPTRASASAIISASASAQYYRPSRAGYKGGRACEAPDSLSNWQRYGALWLNAACHRSLYSYQTRTALALAVQYPHIAVTYLPLACTGATIADGLFGSQRARECPPSKSSATCQAGVNGAARRAARRR